MYFLIGSSRRPYEAGTGIALFLQVGKLRLRGVEALARVPQLAGGGAQSWSWELGLRILSYSQRDNSTP